MNVLPIITDLVDSGALDCVAKQTGASSFQIGHATCSALHQANSGRPANAILAASIANAGISPSLATAVQSALIPLVAHHFTPQARVAAAKRNLCPGLRDAALRLVGAARA